MKALKITLVALFVSTLSFAQTAEVKKVSAPQQPAPTKQSELKWVEESHDFGDIEKGKPVSYEFTFVNTTKQPILVTNVKASCGCTATNYTKTPVKPGEKGTVTATYNAAPGNFHKTVTVTTNEEGAAPKILIIKGSVKKPEAEEKSILLK